MPAAPDSTARSKDLKVPDFIQRGKVLIVRRQYQEAVKTCRLGLLAHPTFVEGRLVLGMALMALSRHDEVLAEMRVALELDPGNPMAHLLKGEALYYKRDYEQSREVLEYAQELDPLNEKVRKLLDEIDELVDYGHEAGPRAKTETKVYPAQRAQDSAFGHDPSDVLSYAGGFHEWDSGLDPDDPTHNGDTPPPIDPETGGIYLEPEEAATDVDDPFTEGLDEEEEDEFTTAPFLPPTHMAQNHDIVEEGAWADSTISEDEPNVHPGGQAVLQEDQTVEREDDGYIQPLGRQPSVILEDQTREVEQQRDGELEWEHGEGPDEADWSAAAPDTPSPDRVQEDGDDGLDDEEPTWVPGEQRYAPPPLGEIGAAYPLGQLDHDEPTVPIPNDGPGTSSVHQEVETSTPIRAVAGLEDDYEEDEEDDTVVNADAPPPEALFGDEDVTVEPPLAAGHSLPRGVDDATKAVDLDRRSGGAALDVGRLPSLDRTPSVPQPSDVSYVSGVSGVDHVSDDAGTREIVSADPRDHGMEDGFASDGQILTPPPAAALPLPPLGSRVLSDDSGIEELESGDIIIAGEASAGDLGPEDSDLSEISVEMLPDDLGEMPPLPKDAQESSAYDASVPGAGADPLPEPILFSPSDANLPAFDISAPEAGRPYGDEPFVDPKPFDPEPFDPEPFANPKPYVNPEPYVGQEYHGEEYHGEEYQAEEYQGEEYQGEEYHGEEYQGEEYQAEEYQGEEYQGEEYQGEEYHGEQSDSGDMATRVKFDHQVQEAVNIQEHLDPLAAANAGRGASEHETFAFEEPAYQDPAAQRPVVPMMEDDDELSLEPADQSGEQPWQDRGIHARTAALDQDDGREYPYDDPYGDPYGLNKEPTMETRPGGPQGLRQVGRPEAEANGNEMLQQMTGESGLFHSRASSQPKQVDDRLRRRRMPEGTATSWINILVGEPGSHRWIYLVGAALGVLALAVAVGLAVRYYRLGEQIQAKRTQAQMRLRAGNLRDFMSAAQSYADILSRRSDDKEAQGMHARILAAVPFEFGDPIPGSEEQRSGDEQGGGEDRSAADIYANLYGGSLSRSSELILQARKHHPESAVLPYLHGRIALLEGNAAAAVGHLTAARKLAPKDALILRALADSHAALGKTKAAVKAYDEALRINSDHVASHLGRARVRVANRKQLIDAEVDLTSITVGKRRKLASRGQQGWAYLVLARLASDRGQQAQAKQHINQAKRHKPARDPLFQDELAGVLIDSFQLGEAEKAIRKSKQLMKGRPHPFYHMARIHLLHGRPKAALEELKHAKGLQYAASNLLRARIYVELKLLDKANREVDRALGMAEELLEAHVVKAQVLAAQGHGTAAESKLRSLLGEYPKNSMLLTAYGEVYARMGKLEEAQQQFLAALRYDKHAFNARLKLAEVHMTQGKYREARKSLTEARRANYGNIMILNKLAAVEFAMGDLAEAATIYQEAKKRAPNDPKIRLDLARVYTEQRKLDRVKIEIKAAAAHLSEKGALALAKGRFNLAQRRAPIARGFLITATKQLPKDAEAWDLLVRAHLMNNDESGARGAANEMASQIPGSPEAEASIGRVVLNQGQSSQAIRHLNKAKQLLTRFPRPPRIRAAILVLLGRAYQDNGRLAEAAGQYEDAANVCPLCAEPYYRRGLVQDERGEADAAIQSLRKALKLNERYSEVHLDLGQVFEGAGQKAKAIESYRKYLATKPPKTLANAARDAIQNLQ